MQIESCGNSMWEIPKTGKMNVPVRIFANPGILEMMKLDNTLQQAQNVAMLPGIVDASIVMPDGHQGYGFPIGGVAAFDMESGVISPGGVGYDINCGVRVLTTRLSADEVEEKKDSLLESLFRNVPSGVGSQGKIRLPTPEMDVMLEFGAKWAVESGYGDKRDITCTEEGGMLAAEPELVSKRAKKRGSTQLGSLGSGNHFLEIQKVDSIFDKTIASRYGLEEDMAVVMIHTGSRGCGHQVCSDFLRTMEKAVKRYGIYLPDRELACAPISSPEGREYIKAMGCAANFAWANRQLITHWVRESFEEVYGEGDLRVLYDVAHNIAKKERHGKKDYMVHRKGATRALWKGRKEVPVPYRDVGQPVLLPGSMGTSSYILCGSKMSSVSFGSTAHGAGRVLSRSKAIKQYSGEEIQADLARKGIGIRAERMKTVAEEAPGAYKDIDIVATVSDEAGIATKVARLAPMGVIKG